MAEYGEELVKEYLESEREGGQWFVLTNLRVKDHKSHSPGKEIDILAVKVSKAGRVVDKIVGEVKSWINFTLYARHLKEINQDIFENISVKEGVKEVFGGVYRRVVFCVSIPKNEKTLREFNKELLKMKIEVKTFKEMLDHLRMAAEKDPTKYDPAHYVSHTLRHLKKNEMLTD